MARVLQCSEFGGPEVLNIAYDTARPLLPHEVRYDVRAFALNRADLMFLNGEHFTIPEFPSRIGQEAAGVVTEVGAAVTEFAVGDRVTALPFHTLVHGVQGETAITPEEYLAHLPETIDFVRGTSIWMQYLTSWFAFTEAARLNPGDTVLIPAAASSAGLGALQISRMLGLTPIAMLRSPAKKAIVEAQGAAAIVYDGDGDLAEVVDRVSNGNGIAAAFDPIGGDSLAGYVDLLGHGATVFGYGTLSDLQPVVPVAAMVRAQAVFHPYSMFNHVADKAQRDRAVAAISAGLQSGVLDPIIDQVFPFEQFREAYSRMESNAQTGKIVVEI